VEDWVKRIYEEEKKRRGIPLEIKQLNGNYYLYHPSMIRASVVQKGIGIHRQNNGKRGC